MENMSRRKFLKLGALSAGLVTLAGCATIKKTPVGGGEFTTSSAEEKVGKWGMFIDMEKIDDIDAIAKICHEEHNVPNVPETNHQVKWIWAEPFHALFHDISHEGLQEKYNDVPFVTTCNHCRKPVCVKVCPTQATFQSENGGLILQDMHRCIGCRNCMAACPYGSRSFNFVEPRDYIDHLNPEYPTRMKGVVEKCDFCYDRLAKGKTPLCAENSNGGIVVGDLDNESSEISKLIRENMTIVRGESYGTQPCVYYKVSLAEGEA